MFGGYVSNARRASGSMVKDRGTAASMVVSMVVLNPN
jgi:hypothetical protein